MKLLAASILIALASCAAGQTAQVIALTPADAAKAKALFDEKARIEQEISKLQVQILVRYTTHDDYQWHSGFEYSTDFKFIVPKTFSTAPCSYSYTLGNVNPCAVFTVGPVNATTTDLVYRPLAGVN